MGNLCRGRIFFKSSLYRINITSKEFQNADESIELYIDMLSCVGSNKQRFSKIKYNFKYKAFDYSSFKNISQDSLPKAIVDKMKLFYSKDNSNIWANLLLSDNEKDLVLQTI